MNSFNDIKQAAKETMGTIADRSVELYKIAEEKTRIIAKRTRLSAEIAVEKGGVRNLYKEIGKLYYALHNTEPEPALRQLCTEVDEALTHIEAKQEQLNALKYAGFAESQADPEDDAPAYQAAAEPAEPAEPAPADPVDAAPPEVDAAPQQDEWQKKYPPEFRL